MQCRSSDLWVHECWQKMFSCYFKQDVADPSQEQNSLLWTDWNLFLEKINQQISVQEAEFSSPTQSSKKNSKLVTKLSKRQNTANAFQKHFFILRFHIASITTSTDWVSTKENGCWERDVLWEWENWRVRWGPEELKLDQDRSYCPSRLWTTPEEVKSSSDAEKLVHVLDSSSLLHI